MIEKYGGTDDCELVFIFRGVTWVTTIKFINLCEIIKIIKIIDFLQFNKEMCSEVRRHKFNQRKDITIGKHVLILTVNTLLLRQGSSSPQIWTKFESWSQFFFPNVKLSAPSDFATSSESPNLA